MANSEAAIVKLVETIGPCLSSTIVEKLTAGGVSEEAARQRISRTVQRKLLYKIIGIAFPRRESFLYTKQQFEDPIFFEKLWEALSSTHSIVAQCIHGMDARGGLIVAGHFAGVCGAPDRLRKQLPPERVLQFLQRYRLIDVRIVQELGQCYQFAMNFPLECTSTPNRLKARLVAERIALDYLRKWLSRLGFISWDSAELRTNSTQPEFGQFHWDLTTPSYVHPFVGATAEGEPKPGFVVADVIINGRVETRHVGSFLRKCETIRHQKNPRPFMSMIVADHFSHDAFTAIRNNGSLAITTENLLGKDLSDALRTLISILTNTAEMLKANPEVIHDVFGKLNAIEGAAGNLRGPLFELIVAHCVGHKEAGTIEVQKLIRDESQVITDIDVLRIIQKNQLIAYECKGHLGNTNVSATEVSTWVEKTIPNLRKYFLTQEQFNGAKHRFEFWTTGILGSDALQYLQEMKAKIRKFEIDWRDGKQVLAYVSESGVGKLADVLRENYLNHPLPKMAQKVAKKAKSDTATPDIDPFDPTIAQLDPSIAHHANEASRPDDR